jgi:hypothetical protein
MCHSMSLDRLNQLKRDAKATPEYEEFNHTAQHVQKQLAHIFQVPHSAVSSWLGMQNTIDCLRGNNMTLPADLTPELIENVSVCAECNPHASYFSRTTDRHLSMTCSVRNVSCETRSSSLAHQS